MQIEAHFRSGMAFASCLNVIDFLVDVGKIDPQTLSTEAKVDLQKTNPIESGVNSGTQKQVRDFVEQFAAVIREGRLERIMSFYSGELVAFDMMPPIQFNSAAEYRQIAWKECFTDYFHFPVQYEYRDQEFEVVDDLAIMHALVHMSGRSKKGEDIEAWLRTTLVIKRIDDEWLITHEHNSAPADPETGQVLMNLQPSRSTH